MNPTVLCLLLLGIALALALLRLPAPAGPPRRPQAPTAPRPSVLPLLIGLVLIGLSSLAVLCGGFYLIHHLLVVRL